MVIYETQAWRPRRYLHHLCCVHARNLADVDNYSRANAWYFEVAIKAPADASSNAGLWTCIYTSEQVQATRNPDWAALAWDASSRQQAALLQEVSRIQISVYTHTQHPSQNHRPAPGHVLFRHNRGVVPPPGHRDGSAQHLDGAAAYCLPAPSCSASKLSTSSTFINRKHQREPAFSAEVDLNDLIVIQGTLAALDVCLPPNTLVLDLKEGFCLFPSLELQSAAESQQAVSAALPTDQEPVPQEPGQDAREQLMQSLLRPPSRPATPSSSSPEVAPPDQPHHTPEVGRLKGLVKAKLGIAFGAGPDLTGTCTPVGLTPEQQTRRTSSHQASTTGRYTKVDLTELDTQMVRLTRSQRAFDEVLKQKEQLQEQLTQALQLRSTARQQSLKLDALRHARHQHHEHAARCIELKAGSARRQQLARTILKAQLQSLHHALTVLKVAYGRLSSADLMLRGPEGTLRYRPLHAELVGRRCRMATLLGTIFRLGPHTVTVCQAPPGGFLEDQLERGWWAASDAGSSASSSNSPRAVVVSQGKQTPSKQNGLRQMALLSVGGLDLDPLLGKGGLEGLINWEPDRTEMRRAAAALGYTALIVKKLAVYLDVPLRFPIMPGSCKTVILTHATSAGIHRCASDVRPTVIRSTCGDSQTAFQRNQHAGIAEFPLYCEGVDRTRFAYGIYLLNKDVEQILNMHGLTATGASQVLANLHKLLAAAASA